MIRGRGTEKEGKGRFGRLPQQGDGEPMHAIIEAPSEAMLKKCCDKIHQIIKVGLECPDGQNELKRMQLRELASLNGTLRDDEIAAKYGFVAHYLFSVGVPTEKFMMLVRAVGPELHFKGLKRLA